MEAECSKCCVRSDNIKTDIDDLYTVKTVSDTNASSPLEQLFSTTKIVFFHGNIDRAVLLK